MGKGRGHRLARARYNRYYARDPPGRKSRRRRPSVDGPQRAAIGLQEVAPYARAGTHTGREKLLGVRGTGGAAESLRGEKRDQITPSETCTRTHSHTHTSICIWTTICVPRHVVDIRYCNSFLFFSSRSSFSSLRPTYYLNLPHESFRLVNHSERIGGVRNVIDESRTGTDGLVKRIARAPTVIVRPGLE